MGDGWPFLGEFFFPPSPLHSASLFYIGCIVDFEDPHPNINEAKLKISKNVKNEMNERYNEMCVYSNEVHCSTVNSIGTE